MRYGKSGRTDLFAKLFVRHFNSQPKAGKIRDLCELEILHTINPFIFIRGVRTLECRLYMGEKLEILKARNYNTRFLINDSSDIYGPCQHRTKFHRFHCTDELYEIQKNSPNANLPQRRNLLCLNKRAPQQELTSAVRQIKTVRGIKI